MITAIFTVVILVLTVTAFWKREPVLYLLSSIGWFVLTFLLANLEYPTGNNYLQYAVIGFCLSATLVMSLQTVRTFFSDRVRPPTPRERSREVQDEHRRKVASLTKRKERPWYDQ